MGGRHLRHDYCSLPTFFGMIRDNLRVPPILIRRTLGIVSTQLSPSFRQKRSGTGSRQSCYPWQQSLDER